MARKSIIILAGVAVALTTTTALGLYWRFGRESPTLSLYGVVEIQEVRLGSKIGGRVAKVEVREGDTVKANQPLIWFEVDEVKKQRDQAAARLFAARTEREKVEKSLPLELLAAKKAAEAAAAEYKQVKDRTGPEIDIAKHDLTTAEADLKLALLQYTRVSDLFQRSAASKAEYDQVVAKKQKALGTRDAAKIRVFILESTREEVVAAARARRDQTGAEFEKLNATQYQIRQQARAKVEELEAKLGELDVLLREEIVRAPVKASVEVVAVRKGDLVAPSQPVLRILRSGDMWVKVFVPETEMGKLRHEQKVQVYVDAYPARPFQGRIVHIGSISEFTPRNVQSVEERRYQVFPVKIRVDDPQGVFRAGMAARVVVPLAQAP